MPEKAIANVIFWVFFHPVRDDSWSKSIKGKCIRRSEGTLGAFIYELLPMIVPLEQFSKLIICDGKMNTIAGNVEYKVAKE